MATKKKSTAKKKKAAAPKKHVVAKKKVAVAPKRKRVVATKKKAAPKRVAPKKEPAAKKKAGVRRHVSQRPLAAKPRRQQVAPRESLAMETVILATPERVYAAWIDGPEHSEFTGGEAIIDARAGGRHSAWSGYIEGTFVELDEGKRIVMTWRTTEFDQSDPDSRLEVRFHADGGGTRLELVHTDLPAGGAHKYETGWREFYFVPMRKYFG